MATNTKFRNGSGSLYTKSLFVDIVEQSWGGPNVDPLVCLYTTEKTDRQLEGKTYPSLYRLYMSMNDPGELLFANAYFEDYEHWMRICEASWFKPLIAKWRQELDLRTRTKALLSILDVANDPLDKNSFAANRYLLEKGFGIGAVVGNRKSNLSKKELAVQEAQKLFNTEQEGDVATDAKRINLC